jgi:hypothetical protein
MTEKQKLKIMKLWAVIETDFETGIGLFQTIQEALYAAETMTASPEAKGKVFVPVPIAVQGMEQGDPPTLYRDPRKEVTKTSWNPMRGYL